MALSGSIKDREMSKFVDADGETAIRVFNVNSGGGGSVSQDRVYIAGETISATKFIYLLNGEVFLAQPDVFSKSISVGVAKTAGSAGSNILTQDVGDFYDSSFSLTLGEPVYLGENGSITQTQPLTGFRVLLGFSIATNGIRISIQEPIGI